MQDSKNPENEGKAFLFRFGKRIFDKIMLAVKPEFEDEVQIDPFDLWEGANFKLKIREFEGQVNYDSSSFEKVSQLLPTDKEMEEVWKKEYSLTKFIAPEAYKEYEKMEDRLNKVLGLDSRVKVDGGSADQLDLSDDEDEKTESQAEENVVEDEKPESSEESETPTSDDKEVDDEDTLAFFEGLAGEDS